VALALGATRDALDEPAFPVEVELLGTAVDDLVDGALLCFSTEVVVEATLSAAGRANTDAERSKVKRVFMLRE
jgi:hypothetical protein